MPRIPTVFISSTSDDLPEYREAARNAALQAGFYPSMMEYFTASGARPPLDACLEKVDAADLVLAIVAYRYGWIPADQTEGQRKSVTWLECERAAASKKEVIACVTDAPDWPHDRREEFRLMQAARNQKLTPELSDEVQHALRSLGEFKAWLDAQGVRAKFRTPDDLGRQVAHALNEWRQRHPDFDRAEAPRIDDKASLAAYRHELIKSCQYLPLRGIDVESADPTSDAARVELAKVYVTLNTTTQVEIPQTTAPPAASFTPDLPDAQRRTRRLSALDAIVANPRVVILGGPGSGKTTLLNHLTFCLAQHQSEPQLDWLSQLEGWPAELADLTPIVVVLRNFARTIEGRPKSVAGRADLLVNFVKSQLEAQSIRSAAAPLEAMLDDGRALVLLDGLDEVQTIEARATVAAAILAFSRRFDRSRYIVTCRTLSYQDKAVNVAGFATFELASFDQNQVDAFIGAWYAELRRLGQIDGHTSDLYRERLQEAVRRGDLTQLAPNPLLLTVMALVHTHKGRLPDARAQLYEEIVDILLWRWESRRGEEHAGLRASLRDVARSESDLKRTLWRLAYETHLHGGSANRDGPADIDEGSLLRALAVLHPTQSRDWAWRLVELMKLRAGLLLEREPGLFTFPHRTFQEYLAGAHLSVQERFAEQCNGLAANTSWRQPILLAVGRLVHVTGAIERPLSLARELCPAKVNPAALDEVGCRRAWLAGEVLDEVGVARLGASALGQELGEDVPKVLAALLAKEFLSPVERASVGTTLGKLGDPRFDASRWFLPAGDLLGFIKVEGGPFLMGSDPTLDPAAKENEQPQHLVDLPAFYISRFPVTVAQFKTYADDARPRLHDPRCVNSVPNYPVVNITWHEAMEYCRWLSQKLRTWSDAPPNVDRWLSETVRAGFDVRLPSEAEWEKAARGTDGRIYSWGSTFNPENTDEPLVLIRSAVGTFPLMVSPCGAFDMGANVWEMTRTLWGPDGNEPLFRYPYAADDGREDLSAPDNVHRVVRSGSTGFLGLGNKLARVASRGRTTPDFGGRILGFRVVLPLPPR